MTDDEILAFVAQYKGAFNRLDGAEIADCYSVPMSIVSDQGASVFADYAQVRRNMDALVDHYRRIGFIRARTIGVDIDHITDHLASVDVDWTMLCDTEAQEFGTRYWIRATDNGPRICAALAYSERPTTTA